LFLLRQLVDQSKKNLHKQVRFRYISGNIINFLCLWVSHEDSMTHYHGHWTQQMKQGQRMITGSLLLGLPTLVYILLYTTASGSSYCIHCRSSTVLAHRIISNYKITLSVLLHWVNLSVVWDMSEAMVLVSWHLIKQSSRQELSTGHNPFLGFP